MTIKRIYAREILGENFIPYIEKLTHSSDSQTWEFRLDRPDIPNAEPRIYRFSGIKSHSPMVNTMPKFWSHQGLGTAVRNKLAKAYRETPRKPIPANPNVIHVIMPVLPDNLLVTVQPYLLANGKNNPNGGLLDLPCGDMKSNSLVQEALQVFQRLFDVTPGERHMKDVGIPAYDPIRGSMSYLCRYGGHFEEVIYQEYEDSTDEILHTLVRGPFPHGWRALDQKNFEAALHQGRVTPAKRDFLRKNNPFKLLAA